MVRVIANSWVEGFENDKPLARNPEVASATHAVEESSEANVDHP